MYIVPPNTRQYTCVFDVRGGKVGDAIEENLRSVLCECKNAQKCDNSRMLAHTIFFIANWECWLAAFGCGSFTPEHLHIILYL